MFWKSGKSLHNLRHQKQTVGLRGRVAQSLGCGQRRTDLIGPGDVDERHCMGSGFNLRDVELFQFFDVTEDVAELCADLFLFVGRERQPREMGDIFDIDIGCSHAERVRFEVAEFKGGVQRRGA